MRITRPVPDLLKRNTLSIDEQDDMQQEDDQSLSQKKRIITKIKHHVFKSLTFSGEKTRTKTVSSLRVSSDGARFDGPDRLSDHFGVDGLEVQRWGVWEMERVVLKGVSKGEKRVF